MADDVLVTQGTGALAAMVLVELHMCIDIETYRSHKKQGLLDMACYCGRFELSCLRSVHILKISSFFKYVIKIPMWFNQQNC